MQVCRYSTSPAIHVICVGKKQKHYHKMHDWHNHTLQVSPLFALGTNLLVIEMKPLQNYSWHNRTSLSPSFLHSGTPSQSDCHNKMVIVTTSCLTSMTNL